MSLKLFIIFNMELRHGASRSYFSISQSDVFSFQWKIERFSKLKYNAPISSPVFYLSTKEDPWYLDLIRPSKCILALHLCNKTECEVDLETQITVSQDHGDSIHSNSDSIDIHEFSRFRKTDLLPNISLPSCPTRNDFITITCSIKVRELVISKKSDFFKLKQIRSQGSSGNNTTEPKTCLQNKSNIVQNDLEEDKYQVNQCHQKIAPDSISNIATSQSPLINDYESLRQLSIDFKRLFNQSINSDVVIRVEDLAIKAHKAILCARSPVFRRMFKQSTLIAVKNEIVVTDISSSVMQKFVNYLYSGEKVLQYTEAAELYYAADKYEVFCLREACVEDLLCVLDVNNACSMLSMANCHGDDVFKDKIMLFISENFKAVSRTKSWIKLIERNTKLSAVLLHYCAQAFTK